MKKMLFPILLFVLGLLIILTPMFLAPGCPQMENGKWMKCHWTAQAEIGAGAVVMLLGLLAFFQNQAVRRGLYEAALLLAALVLALPSCLIGTCMKATMICNSTTKPLFYALGICLLFVSLLALFLDRDKQQIPEA